MFFYLVSFILLLGPLVFVHEFGHYLFAKLFNVRVDIFSMGFGPKIFKKKWGETEYCVSAIPLGGYVKLFGQDPTEVIDSKNKHRSLNAQEAWKRFLIFIGGPLFNFLFAIFVFSVLLVVGEPHVAAVVDRVVPSSYAEKAGFRSGDVVTAIDKKVVTKFEEVNQIILDAPGKELVFRVKRGADVKELKATPKAEPGFSIYGEAVDVGEIEGLTPFGRHPVLGVSSPNSDVAKAGIKTSDEIVTLNGKPVKNFESFEKEIAQINSNPTIKQFTLGIMPHAFDYWEPENKPLPSKSASKEITLKNRPLKELGVFSSELFVYSVIAGSPAEKAGLKAGDRLISVDGDVLHSFSQLRGFVQRAGEQRGKMELVLERAGKKISFEVIPNSNEVTGPSGQPAKQFVIGVYPLFVQSEPTMFFERIFNPFTLTVESWSRALDLSAKTLVSIKKLVTRQVSMGTLGGPILIGKLAGDSMQRGVSSFLKVMALISISLAIFNILPVPILDGGHIFLLLVEVIRGKPITLRQSEVVQQIGLTFIVFLLVVVLLNDFSRVGLPALRHIFQ